MLSQPLNSARLIAAISVAVLIVGCQSNSRIVDDRYSQITQDYDFAQSQALAVENAVTPVAPDFSGAHNVVDFLAIGLAQNPEIQEMRLLVESLANRVPQAASLSDPMLGITAFPSPVQTAAGQQEFAIAMSQKSRGVEACDAKCDCRTRRRRRASEACGSRA